MSLLELLTGTYKVQILNLPLKTIELEIKRTKEDQDAKNI